MTNKWLVKEGSKALCASSSFDN